MSFDVVSSNIVYDGKLSRMRVDEVRMPDGDTATREVCEHLDAVAVVPLTDDGQVILVRQYRHPFGGYQLEIPAGMLDVEGETAEAAARRELVEETGLETAELTEMLRFRNSAGWTDETTIIYLAKQVRPGNQPPHFEAVNEEADMEVVRMPVAEAVTMAANGGIPDAKTLIGLLLLANRG